MKNSSAGQWARRNRMATKRRIRKTKGLSLITKLFIAFAIVLGIVIFSNGSSNIAQFSAPISTKVPLPDIIVSSVEVFPRNPTLGNAISVTFTITNVGGSTYDPQGKGEIYQAGIVRINSDGGDINGYGENLLVGYDRPIPVGSAITITHTYNKIPSTNKFFPEGRYQARVYFAVNSRGECVSNPCPAESNLANNIGYSKIFTIASGGSGGGGSRGSLLI